MANARLIGLWTISLLMLLVSDISAQDKLSDIIKKHPQLTKFKEAIDKAAANGFSWSINVDMASAVFAPINAAWDIAPVIPDNKLPEKMQSHFINEMWTWALMTGMKAQMNRTQRAVPGGYKQLLFHEEHGDYFVCGAKFVTSGHTDPPNNEIQAADGKTLFLIDRVLAEDGHKDNFYDHMIKDEAQASEFGKLVEHYKTAGGTNGQNFANRLKVVKGTLLVPKSSSLTNPLVVQELEVLKANTEELGKVLKSHLVENNFIFTRYFHEEVTWDTLGEPFISHAADPVKHPGVDRLIEGGGVVAELKDSGANITMSNGVMHLIDALLHYKFTAYTVIGTNKVVDVGGGVSQPATGGLFMKAIQKVPSVMNKLKDRSATVTVFAPTHLATGSSEHFKALVDQIPPTANEQERDASKLAKLLNTCIIDQTLTLAKLKEGVTVQNLNGTSLKSMMVGKDLYVESNGVRARVLETNADLQAANGVVHVIDKVLGLKGTTVWEKLTQSNLAGQLTKFNNLVKSTGLDTVLNDPNLELTVFAPVDSSFDRTALRYPNQVPSFEDFLTKDKYTAGRKVFVQRHIVLKKVAITASSAVMSLNPMNANEKITVDPIGDGGGAIRVTYNSVGGMLMIPLGAGTADNGNIYRVRDGTLYSMDDPKVGATTGASATSISILLTTMCLVWAVMNL